MRHQYQVTLVTTAGKTFRFGWSCDEVKLSHATPESILMGNDYICVDQSGASKTMVPKNSIDHIKLTDKGTSKL